MGIKEKFDSISERYDQQRRQLIPCFDDFYNIALGVLNFNGESPKILDIGCGTGLFSSFLLNKYPKAKITLIDLSDKMLETAKARFADYPNFKFIVGNYMTYEFGEQFDIIISALSIHHLSHSEKKALYNKCYGLLYPNGIFINADQVLSPSSELEKTHLVLFKQFHRQSGLDEQEIQKAWERMEYDNPSTLNDQLNWLTESGFRIVDSIYKYYLFCVIYAKK